MPSRRLDPDVALEIKLVGTASRLVEEGLDAKQVVMELRSLAGGRGDLLAAAAGLELGGYLAKPGSCHPNRVAIAGCLILAGADPEAVVEHADAVRRRSDRSAYRL